MTSPASEPHYIGIDITGPSLRAALVSASGEVVHRRALDLNRDDLIAQITGLTVELRDLVPAIAAIGVGLPGLVNHLTDKVVVSADLPAAVKGDFHSELTAATGMRVEIENDANAAAYGEYQLGAGRGSRDIFYVTIGTGIGGALILDGKLWTGASGFAGEFGHITIDSEGGAQCVCGNIGCLETVASAPNIVRRTHERLYRDSTSSLSRLALNREFTADDVANEALNGDDFAAMMLERTGKYIGAAIASVINLLNIERIVLGGGVMGAGELILNPIIHEAQRRAFQPCFESTQIVVATLGHDAVPLGAALLARDAHPADRHVAR